MYVSGAPRATLARRPKVLTKDGAHTFAAPCLWFYTHPVWGDLAAALNYNGLFRKPIWCVLLRRNTLFSLLPCMRQNGYYCYRLSGKSKQMRQHRCRSHHHGVLRVNAETLTNHSGRKHRISDNKHLLTELVSTVVWLLG